MSARLSEAEMRVRDERALVLHVQGQSLAAIGRAVGLRSKTSVSEAIGRATRRLATESDVETARAESVASVTALREHLWRRLHNPPPLVDRVGRVVTDPVTGDRVVDTHAEATVASALLRTEARLASLLGLDAPSQSAVITLDAVELAIRQAEADLARREISSLWAAGESTEVD